VFLSKIKEAFICWRANRVTRRYPFEPSPPPEGFRGQPEVDIEKCIGCTACSMACPTRCIELTDTEDERVTVYCLDRCSYCGRCEEVCPTGAVTLSAEFELATDSIDDIRITTHHELVRCEECDEVVGTVREIEMLKAHMAEKVDMDAEQLKWLYVCPECKRKGSLQIAREIHGADLEEQTEEPADPTPSAGT
jgi:hydrogenase-4 component H